jgi:hypothetical protein
MSPTDFVVEIAGWAVLLISALIAILTAHAAQVRCTELERRTRILNTRLKRLERRTP